MSDEAYIERAIELAERGRAQVPNPMVGAVVVAERSIVGEGFHEGPGLPHAEVVALNQAGTARATRPCTRRSSPNHYGRTPPCTEAIVRAGVARVVSATTDPNLVVDGRGLGCSATAGSRCATGSWPRSPNG